MYQTPINLISKISAFSLTWPFLNSRIIIHRHTYRHVYACICRRHIHIFHKAIFNSLGTETINAMFWGVLYLSPFFLSNRTLILFKWQCAELWTVRPKDKFVVEPLESFSLPNKQAGKLILFLFFFILSLNTEIMVGAAPPCNPEGNFQNSCTNADPDSAEFMNPCQ